MAPHRTPSATTVPRVPADPAELPVGIVGSGGFGTTLACLLAKKGYSVTQWVRNERLARAMTESRENRDYLPGVTLPLNVSITTRLADALRGAALVVVAVPSHAVHEVAEASAPHLPPRAILLNVAKGIEPGTYRRMSEVLEAVVGADHPIVSLSGPNHAEEIGRDMPGATVIASRHPEVLPFVREVLSTRNFKVFPHTDLVGVELGGVTKNIVAIVAGICDGLGLGDNSKAAIITLGLSEMIRFGRHYGAKSSTFMGLAGLGDLLATCYSKHSRNRFVGEHLGKGEPLEEVLGGLHGMVAEGVKATRFVHETAKANGIQMPLTDEVYRVLYEGKDIQAAIRDLLELI